MFISDKSKFVFIFLGKLAKMRRAVFHVLVFLFLLQSECQCRRNKLPMKYRHKSGCFPVKMQLDLKFKGCLDRTIFTIGCAGYCKSETTVLIYQKGIVGKCDCCKPKGYQKFVAKLPCPGRKNRPYQHVDILAAKSCACAPCGNRFNKK